MIWRGRYYDGRTARRQDVTVTVSDGTLSFDTDDGSTVVWKPDDLELSAEDDSPVVRLVNPAVPDAVLEVEDPAFPQALQRAAPGIGSVGSRLRRNRRSIVIVVIACIVFAGAVFGVATVLPGVAAALIPSSVQRSVGDNVVGQIVSAISAIEDREGRFCENAAGQAALDRLIRRLAAGHDDVAFRIRVADLQMVNALAAPGGRLLATRGIIDFAESAEEFAGVIAHEMGHAIHRHPTRAVIREAGLGATLDLLTGGGLGGTTAWVLVRTAYSRDAEREADDAALDLLGRAGIATAGLVRLFERFEKEMPDAPKGLEMISTHPRSAERVERLSRAGAAGGGPAMPDADWQAIRAICDQG